MNTDLRQKPSASVLPAGDAKARLLSSALSLFSKNGYEGTSIREIIEQAGVTRPVLYYYFKNKEDLFRSLVEGLFGEFNEGVDAILVTETGCKERLTAMARLAFDHAERSPEVVGLILQLFFSAPGAGPQFDKERLNIDRMRRIVRIMSDGLGTGELTGGDAGSLALAFSGMLDLPIMAKSHRRDAVLSAEFADGLVELFLHGAGCQVMGSKERGKPLVSPFGPLPGDVCCAK